jgi:hypothetical protein
VVTGWFWLLCVYGTRRTGPCSATEVGHELANAKLRNDG